MDLVPYFPSFRLTTDDAAEATTGPYFDERHALEGGDHCLLRLDADLGEPIPFRYIWDKRRLACDNGQ